MKSMTYTVLECYAYDNVLILKYVCTTTTFSRNYVRRHSDLSNPTPEVKPGSETRQT